MKYKIGLLALLAATTGYRLQQHNADGPWLHFESEGPTKEDNGDSDPTVLYRESDTNDSDEPSAKCLF
jgi:hypothetical protein